MLSLFAMVPSTHGAVVWNIYTPSLCLLIFNIGTMVDACVSWSSSSRHLYHHRSKIRIFSEGVLQCHTSPLLLALSHHYIHPLHPYFCACKYWLLIPMELDDPSIHCPFEKYIMHAPPAIFSKAFFLMSYVSNLLVRSCRIDARLVK